MVKVGDRIRIKSMQHLFQSLKTKQWMANYAATVVKVNKKSVTVVFDSYPDEKHYVDLDDFEVLREVRF